MKTFIVSKNLEYDFMNLAKGEQVGLIAQDVEIVFPQLVQNSIHYLLKNI